jgi:hypothetical protein
MSIAQLQEPLPKHRPQSWLTGSAVALATVCLLSGCGKGITEKQRVQLVIDEGLAKKSVCRDVPVGIPASAKDIAESALFSELVAQGYVVEGQIVSTSYSGKEETKAGYVFTDKANGLIQTPAKPNWPYRQACFKAGIWKTTSIEAVDTAANSNGNLITSVRTRIEFVPEAWLLETKNKPEWAAYWRQLQSQQDKQWIYSLLKSGDDFFFGGNGQSI